MEKEKIYGYFLDSVVNEWAHLSKHNCVKLAERYWTRVIERGQLRDARLALGSMGADPVLESYVWQHPDVVPQIGLVAALHLEARKRRLGAFSKLPAGQQEQSLNYLRIWRQALPDEVYFSELWDLPVNTKAYVNAHDLDDARDYIALFYQQAIDPDLVVDPKICAWFSDLKGQLSSHVHADETIKHAVQQLIGMSEQSHDKGRWPDKAQSQNWFLAQQGNYLSSIMASSGVGSFMAELTSRSGFVEFELTDTAPILANSVSDRNAFWVSGSPPAWAAAWGIDEYGAWVEFSYQGINQRLRWIPAGSFLIGSPNTEQERFDREGPQHRVILSKGYWLFDTAINQALWQAVMGDNPAHFKGDDLPIESISWHDANRFISKLNAALSGLQLSLPTEAQWEYACRAGSQSPFNTGENLTTDQANYNGEYPYADFPKGEYREKTVPVKQFDPNDWGLYQMHGNVDEWCADAMREYSAEGVTDPVGPQSYDTDKVLRGGAWDDDARDARCAYRNAAHPVFRSVDIGFRCARVQREPGEATPALAGKRPAELGRRQPAGAGDSGAAETAKMQSGLVFNLHDWRARVPLQDAPGVILRSDVESLRLECINKPEWAAAIGRDRVGLWCEIRYKQAKQQLRWIPPGRFTMGSPVGEPGRIHNEGPAHQVVISQGYWLFDTPVTQVLWTAVMEMNPSRFQSSDRPVEQVSWEDVQVFLTKINALIPDLQLCLPTEAQWEYACRAGTRSAIYTGELQIVGDANAPALDPIAWYGGNSSVDFELDNGLEREWLRDMQYPDGKAGTHPVGRKAPSAWGLYDMLGNVWEWCADGLREYQTEPEIDPLGPIEEGVDRVLRGGAWNYDARLARCAYRLAYHPDFRLNVIGFRCARVQREPGQKNERSETEGRRRPTKSGRRPSKKKRK